MSLRVFYWNKHKKKTIYKQASIKKFNNDKEKCQAFLDNWKNEEIKKMNNTSHDLKQEKTPSEERPQEETQQEKQEEEPQQETQQETINYNDLYEITPFKLQLAEEDEGGTTTLIFGSSKSGKTSQLKHLIKEHYENKEYITFLIADNIFNSHKYKNIDKKIIRLSRFNDELIKGINKIQKKTKNKYKFCFIFDDIILHKNNKVLLQMILTMRNAHISTVMCLQSTTLLNRQCRFNVNNVIFRKNNSNEGTTECLDFFLSRKRPFSRLKTMDEKAELYNHATQDNGFIYLDAINGGLSFHQKYKNVL